MRLKQSWQMNSRGKSFDEMQANWFPLVQVIGIMPFNLYSVFGSTPRSQMVSGGNYSFTMLGYPRSHI